MTRRVGHDDLVGRRAFAAMPFLLLPCCNARIAMKVADLFEERCAQRSERLSNTAVRCEIVLL